MRRFLTALILWSASSALAQEPPERAALIEGVKAIAYPGSPGAVNIFGKDAVPIVATGDGSKKVTPIVAVGRLGSGRVVLLGHEGYFSKQSLTVADTRKFLLNCIAWAGHKPKQIGVIGHPELVNALTEDGLPVRDLGRNWPKDIPAVQLLIGTANSIPADALPALRNYLKAGGGLIVGSPGWGWAQINPTKSLDRDHPGNLLLAEAGLGLTKQMSEAPKPRDEVPTVAVSPLHHLDKAIQKLEAILNRKETVSSTESAIAQGTIQRAFSTIPAEQFRSFSERLDKALMSVELPVPTAKSPIRRADIAARLAITMKFQRESQAKVEELKANPMATGFPGVVPADAPRETVQVKLKLGAKGYICNGVGVSETVDIWHSTGRYAAPGEIVTVSVPASHNTRGWGVRVGSHSDRLWDSKDWSRAPEISRVFPFTGNSVRVANPFGGLVYLTVPHNNPSTEVEVTIAGAVAAPLYIHGKTRPEDWIRNRLAPGPWAELASDKLIVTVPSSAIRTLSDPKAVMDFWDRAMDLCADLSAVSPIRGRAERIVHDVQISAGYMHSGYPIMAPLGEVKKLLDPTAIQRNGAWGYFHELGHNHQGRPWTFDGTVEVTCNLYSLYLTEKLCPQAPFHEEIQPAAIRSNARKYLLNGAKFADWQEQPFTALIVYKQMRDEFGWDVYRQAISSYLKPGEKLPKSDAQKRDEWLIRFSKAAGKNIGPALEFWGIPISAEAKKAVADLPPWKPADPSQ